MLVESFFRSFDLPALIIRPFNTFGPRQSARAVIPMIISQALSKPVIKLGSLDPIRDLTYVTDTAAGFIAGANAPDEACGKVYNLGTGKAVSIGDLARTVFELLEGEFSIEQIVVHPAHSQRIPHSSVHPFIHSSRHSSIHAFIDSGDRFIHLVHPLIH